MLSPKKRQSVRTLIELMTGGLVGPFKTERVEPTLKQKALSQKQAEYAIIGLSKENCFSFTLESEALAKEIASVLNKVFIYNTDDETAEISLQDSLTVRLLIERLTTENGLVGPFTVIETPKSTLQKLTRRPVSHSVVGLDKQNRLGIEFSDFELALESASVMNQIFRYED